MAHSTGLLDFVYTPLSGTDAIRILEIEPSSAPNVPITCNIKHVQLDETVTYDALSYSWGMNGSGDASPCRAILIGGRRKAITRNLYEALLRVRDPVTTKTMCIDAVCIDQKDKLERSLQVKKMDRIYAAAKQVIIWLGEGESGEFH